MIVMMLLIIDGNWWGSNEKDIIINVIYIDNYEILLKRMIRKWREE